MISRTSLINCYSNCFQDLFHHKYIHPTSDCKTMIAFWAPRGAERADETMFSSDVLVHPYPWVDNRISLVMVTYEGWDGWGPFVRRNAARLGVIFQDSEGLLRPWRGRQVWVHDDWCIAWSTTPCGGSPPSQDTSDHLTRRSSYLSSFTLPLGGGIDHPEIESKAQHFRNGWELVKIVSFGDGF